MARMIDVDTLRDYWRISEPCERCHWNKIDCSKPPYYSLLDICNAIDEIPTVNAIPVGWLEEQADYARSEWDYDTCEGIRIVLKAWQKEQEGHRDTD